MAEETNIHYKTYQDIMDGKISGSKEMWFDFPENMNLLDYKISTLGNVYSMKSQRNLTIRSHSNDYYSVRINGKNYYVHRLLAMIFIPNPNNYETVDHISRNYKDNTFRNLRWANVYQQNNNRNFESKGSSKVVVRINENDNSITEFPSLISAAHSLGLSSKCGIAKACKAAELYHGYYWKYKSDTMKTLQGERWTKLEKYNITVSNMGRIKNANDKFIEGYIRQGYKQLHIKRRNDKKTTMTTFHRMVCLAFLGKPPSKNHVINHKNGNKLDNRLKNLEYCTRSENAKHAHANNLVDIKKRAAKCVKAVIQCDSFGEEIKQFNSIKEASEQLGISRSGISDSCAGRKIYAGNYKWKYVTDKTHEVLMDTIVKK